jgi:hypothetical protein
MHCSIA